MITRLLSPVALPLLGATSAALLAAGGWIWLQSGWLDDAQAENERLTNQLTTCSARVTNILEDMRDDATVDDPGGFPVPDGWMPPDATTND